MAQDAAHIAFKCTYNNGGEGFYVGFVGTCSEDIIKWNIEQERVWCSQPECPCSQYYARGFKGERPVDPCYESYLFRDWKYGAGRYHTGKRAGQPIHLSRPVKGKLAIFTTRFPGDKEKDRRIIGFFKIARVDPETDGDITIYADEHFRLRLPLEEAKELYFWDYYSTKGGAVWDTGLFRYLDDDSMVARILLDIEKTLRDENSKALVRELLDRDFSGISPSPPSGPTISKRGDRTKRMAVARKYGPGGEGANHKRLKEWVAENPKEIGLPDARTKHIEYMFTSGDVADIVFDLERDRYAVVEIETEDPLPGAYQALKYKILKCAELGRDIKSPDVEAILVAWSFPKEVKDFCQKYGIRLVEKKL